MVLMCDEKVVYLGEYDVKAFDKQELIERGEQKLLWQTKRLQDPIKKLLAGKDYVFGITSSHLIRVHKEDGQLEEFPVEDVQDIALSLNEGYILTKTDLYRFSTEKPGKFANVGAPAKLERPFVCISLSKDYIYIASKEFIYRLSKEGGLLDEKAFSGTLALLATEEGPVAVKESGEVVFFDHQLESISSCSYQGEFMKAEYNCYHLYLLSTEGLFIFSKLGRLVASIKDSKYITFTEGLNHVYLLKETGLEAASKADLFGEDYQNIDLVTLSAIVLGALHLYSQETGKKLEIHEKLGYIDVRVDGKSLDIYSVTYCLSKYFPELFVYCANPGYYEAIREFAAEFNLISEEGGKIHLNESLLKLLEERHSTFLTFKDDIVKTVGSCQGK